MKPNIKPTVTLKAGEVTHIVAPENISNFMENSKKYFGNKEIYQANLETRYVVFDNDTGWHSGQKIVRDATSPVGWRLATVESHK